MESKRTPKECNCSNCGNTFIRRMSIRPKDILLCKKCWRKKYHEVNKEYSRKYWKIYYEKNKEKIIDKNKMWWKKKKQELDNNKINIQYLQEVNKDSQ